MHDLDKPPLAELAHFGVKGMKWGVRQKIADTKQGFTDYRNEVEAKTPGAGGVAVIAKNGDKLTVTREKIPPSATTIGKVIKRNPSGYVASMTITNKNGKAVGSFQVWREGKNNSVIRGEWLEIDKSEQGKGYSKAALFGMMETARRDSAVKEVRLQVPSSGEAAKSIYAQLGFKHDYDYGYTPVYGNLEEWVYKVPRGGK